MKNPNMQLWAEDEVHFQRHSTLIRMWSLVGRQPRVVSASTREKVGFLGAINLKTGCLLTKTAPVFNADTFGEFIEHLLGRTQGKIFLILDNARWHRAKALKQFFIKNQHRIVRVYLPPYSPELNPIERVWRITRRLVTHNRCFETTEALEADLTLQFAKWQQSNDALKTLCANI